MKPREITHLFLDTTFNDPRFDFPEQSRVIENATELVRDVLRTYRNPLVLFGSYSIGKEKLFVAVAKALGEKLYASAEKQRLLRACCPDMSVFVSDREKARLHVTGLGKSGFNGLKALEAKLGTKYDVYVGIAPTGWTWGESQGVFCLLSHLFCSSHFQENGRDQAIQCAGARQRDCIWRAVFRTLVVL